MPSLGSMLKTASYIVKSQPYKLEKPIVLQFPVIDICNSRCQMCRIWENKKSNDITPQALRKGLRNPLYSEVTSVGLNGGEPTLREDLAELAEVLYQELPRLKNLSIITNAFKYKQAIERIREVGEVVQKHGGWLDVMVSLDGYGEMHDRVRGKPGNFDRAQHVIDFATSSPLVGVVRIGCTIIKENVYGLHDLFEYCQARGLYLKYRLGIPHQRLYTKDLHEPYDLNFAEKYHIAEFLEGLIAHYETNQHQIHFYRSLIGQILHEAPRRAGCDWQHRGATITSRGELLYCAVQSKSLGLIDEVDSAAAYFGNDAHLETIRENHCATCHHDYVGLPDRAEQARRLAWNVLRRSGLERPIRNIARQPHLAQVRHALQLKKRIARFQPLTAAPVIATQAPSGVKKIMICGWYGTETLGDKAILGGILSAARKLVGPIQCTLVSLNPYVSRMTARQMPELDGVQIMDVEGGIARAGGMDLVLFGGGPIMAISELADMEAIFLAAKNHGVARMIAGCGVGPLGAPAFNQAIKRVLELANERIYRDENSKRLAGSLGVDTSQDAVADDPAFTWLSSFDHIARDNNTTSKTLLLGLREFPWRSYAAHLPAQDAQAISQTFETALLAALEKLVADVSGLKILPLPMCTNHFGDDDRWFYRRLFRPASDVLKDRLDMRLLNEELEPLDYAHAFSSADAALTMRFHALVFALGLGVPAVAIDYTLGKGKVKALADHHDVPSRSIGDLDTDFIYAAVLKQLQSPVSPEIAPVFGQTFAQALSGIGFIDR